MEEDRKDVAAPQEQGGVEDGAMAPESGRVPEESPEALKAGDMTSTTPGDQSMELLQRVQADFINFRRRANEEREEMQKYANSRLILKLIPVMDDFNLAIDHVSGSEASAPWLEGVRLIQRKLFSLLESEKVAKIEAEGKEFDPFEHEAMAYQESADQPEGHVLSVVRDGYKLHDRVIRPALVVLAEKADASRDNSSPATEKETQDA